MLSGFWRAGKRDNPDHPHCCPDLPPAHHGLFHLFLQYTRLGKSIRAAAQNREAARIVGIEISSVYAITFAICIAMTGAAGMLTSPTQAIFPSWARR